MKRNLLTSKSFSQVDKGFIQLFKHKRKISSLSGGYKINDLIEFKENKPKKWESEKTDSTSAKLDFIISNMQRSNSYITKQFLEENYLRNENDELRERMQVLYNRRKTKEKKEEETDRSKKRDYIDSTQDAIKHMIYFAKKYAVDKEFVRMKTEQNKKSPPICRYTPSLSYISKHIPVVYFGYHKTAKNENNDNEKINENNKNKSYNKFEEGKNSIINNMSNFSLRIKDLDDKLMITENSNTKSNNSITHYKIKIIKNILNKQNEIDKNIKKQSLLEKIFTKIEKIPNKTNKNITSGKYTLNAQRRDSMKRNIPNIKLNPVKLRYSISVPEFNKMTSREKIYPPIEKNKNMADYNPNYNAIFPNNYRFNRINEKMKKKRYKLRKILGSYNTSGEYVLLPILNKYKYK